MNFEQDGPSKTIGKINGRWHFMGKCWEEIDENERNEFNRYLEQKK